MRSAATKYVNMNKSERLTVNECVALNTVLRHLVETNEGRIRLLFGNDHHSFHAVRRAIMKLRIAQRRRELKEGVLRGGLAQHMEKRA